MDSWTHGLMGPWARAMPPSAPAGTATATADRGQRAEVRAVQPSRPLHWRCRRRRGPRSPIIAVRRVCQDRHRGRRRRGRRGQGLPNMCAAPALLPTLPHSARLQRLPGTRLLLGAMPQVGDLCHSRCTFSHAWNTAQGGALEQPGTSTPRPSRRNGGRTFVSAHTVWDEAKRSWPVASPRRLLSGRVQGARGAPSAVNDFASAHSVSTEQCTQCTQCTSRRGYMTR
jgi:hypothetical protein